MVKSPSDDIICKNYNLRYFTKKTKIIMHLKHGKSSQVHVQNSISLFLRKFEFCIKGC